MIEFLRDRLTAPVILGFFGLLACTIFFGVIRECSADRRDVQIECYKHAVDPKICDPDSRSNEVLRFQYLDNCRQTSRSVDDCLKLYPEPELTH